MFVLVDLTRSGFSDLLLAGSLFFCASFRRSSRVSIKVSAASRPGAPKKSMAETDENLFLKRLRFASRRALSSSVIVAAVDGTESTSDSSLPR